MSIIQELQPYTDGCGLVAPQINPGLIGSDNGPMFTSEAYTIIFKNNQLTEQDRIDYTNKIKSCIFPEGLLNRVPMPYRASQIGPDDLYSVMNACKQLGNTEIPRSILWALIKNFGFLNNDKPGTYTKESFLVRQLQLVAAMVTASFPSFSNPLHFCIRLLSMPLFFVAAISILISCINTPIGEADPRRLSWHLVQTVSGISIMCKLASLVWYKRLYKDYGPTGMRSVATVYYEKGHPFAKWWID